MKKERGFTLLEILVALAIFAILATLTSSSLYYAFNTQARIAKQADQLNALQLAITRMERDSIQAIPQYDPQMPFIGKADYLEFTRNGTSLLRRVSFLCRHHQLIRTSWELSFTQDKPHKTSQVLLNALSHCQFAYLDSNLRILSEWPEWINKQDQNQALPRAIQLNCTIKHWGTINYLFVLGQAIS